MGSSSRAVVLGVIGLVAALMYPAGADLLAGAPSLISMPNAKVPSYDFHDESCPSLRQMVHDSVEEALQEDIGVAAGLLRIMFHDCFPQGCDASLLLGDKFWSEMNMPQNHGMRRNAVYLIENIRVKVQDACGPTVSCTDIMNLATREAVTHFNVPGYNVTVGLLDSPWPAPRDKVNELPRPDSNAAQLIESMGSRGFDVADVVALSGAHTLGVARCSSFKDRFDESTEFARWLEGTCARNPIRLQGLDPTPEMFDNQYYLNLLAGRGVLTSDVQLLHNETTSWWVNNFAQDQGWFFSQFGTSMSKMAHLPSSLGSYGEIRKYSCFWANFRGPEGPAADPAASA